MKKLLLAILLGILLSGCATTKYVEVPVDRVKELKDTVNVTDTITVVKPVEVTKEVNKLHNWQVGLMVLGGAAIALGGYKLIKFIKV